MTNKELINHLSKVGFVNFLNFDSWQGEIEDEEVSKVLDRASGTLDELITIWLELENELGVYTPFNVNEIVWGEKEGE